MEPLTPNERMILSLFLAIVEARVSQLRRKEAAEYLKLVTTLLTEPGAIPIRGDGDTDRARENAAEFWRAQIPDIIKKLR